MRGNYYQAKIFVSDITIDQIMDILGSPPNLK